MTAPPVTDASARRDDGGVHPVDGAPVLRARHAAIGYGGSRVVRDLDLDVHPGESVALLGANGSGKTTLVKGLLGLADVQAGSVELFGVPLARFTQRWRVGYVPQRHTVGGPVPSSVREVVTSGRLARRRWWRPSRPADRDAVERALEVVGLADRAGCNVAELSGGQQRRVLVARALAAEPEVLVMDEPTAGVDASQQVAIARALGALADRQVTLLVVTHEIGPLAPVLDRCVVLDEGRVTHDGPLAEHLLHVHDHAHHLDEHHHDHAPGWVAEPRTR